MVLGVFAGDSLVVVVEGEEVGRGRCWCPSSLVVGNDSDGDIVRTAGPRKHHMTIFPWPKQLPKPRPEAEKSQA